MGNSKKIREMYKLAVVCLLLATVYTQAVIKPKSACSHKLTKNGRCGRGFGTMCGAGLPNCSRFSWCGKGAAWVNHGQKAFNFVKKCAKKPAHKVHIKVHGGKAHIKIHAAKKVHIPKIVLKKAPHVAKAVHKLKLAMKHFHLAKHAKKEIHVAKKKVLKAKKLVIKAKKIVHKAMKAAHKKVVGAKKSIKVAKKIAKKSPKAKKEVKRLHNVKVVAKKVMKVA